MTKTNQHAELQKIREENSRLKSLLKQHGICFEHILQREPTASQNNSHESRIPQLSIEEKIAIFRSLFKGRGDVYAQRWESNKGRSGYSPACANEWKPGLCQKPKVKCGACSHRHLQPVTADVIYNHLSGKQTIGIYPLLNDDCCYFLAADFDGSEWRYDASAFMKSCRELGISAALEISRSGNGAHVWIFFSEALPARDVRQLGVALISHTCDQTRQLSLDSYDRLFPNQDTMPKGGFGNLIALPLQKKPREKGFSVFVDEQLRPYKDQWKFLSSIPKISKTELESSILKVSENRHPLDVSFYSENEHEPWQRPKPLPNKISGTLPDSVSLVLANLIFISKKDLTQKLTNRLIRLAAFQNPEFYKAQKMRLPVWNKPRIIGCAENFPHHVGLPRGCFENVLQLFGDNNIHADIVDQRISGAKIKPRFMGKLREDQKKALQEVSKHEIGILCAPTAFGKTITAAALIAQRKTNTLILVHRKELLRQWNERLIQFLDMENEPPGIIGGGKKKPSGVIDIAVIQSLSRYENLGELLDRYGQIIVDECHHLSAFSFEAIMKQAKSRYIIGLTATPIRRDGQHPIIFMQCGPIRHEAKSTETTPSRLEVHPAFISAPDIPPQAPIQEVFRILSTDVQRNERIINDIDNAYHEGRKILVLTERTDHLAKLEELMPSYISNCFVLHGRLSKKRRAKIFADLESLEETAPRVLLATGRLVGEGFDHPPLDTLMLAMPISWKGTLQQYAGRLHREHKDKTDVRIYDYAETDQPQLARMWNKRQNGYVAMGYQIVPPLLIKNNSTSTS
jgi:superfamily II DNA or RNA helicase